MGEVIFGRVMIDDCKVIETNGGPVIKLLGIHDKSFCGFGEAYFSTINPGSIKAWKRHQKMTMTLTVSEGNVLFVFYDEDKNSFCEVALNSDEMAKLTVMPGVWFGFSNLSSKPSKILNIASIAHDPSEVERSPVDHFAYKWS